MLMKQFLIYCLAILCLACSDSSEDENNIFENSCFTGEGIFIDDMRGCLFSYSNKTSLDDAQFTRHEFVYRLSNTETVFFYVYFEKEDLHSVTLDRSWDPCSRRYKIPLSDFMINGDKNNFSYTLEMDIECTLKLYILGVYKLILTYRYAVLYQSLLSIVFTFMLSFNL